MVVRGQRGQSIALFALVLAIILGALALVIDVGFAYADRRYQQDAADAAALAGARMVFDRRHSDAQVVAEINRVVGLNRGAVNWTGRPPWYVDGGQQLLARVGAGSIPVNAAGVAVISQTNRTGFFSWIVGMPIIPVSAQSVALAQQVQTCNPGDGLVPLTVPIGYLWEHCGVGFSPTEPPASCTVPIDLKSPKYHKVYASVPGSDPPPANWKGVVDFSPKQVPNPVKCPPQNKPKDVECWVEKGFEGEIQKDDDLPTFNGDLGSNTSDLVRNIQTDASGRQYGVIYIPIYDKYNKSTDQINVYSFGAFVVYLDEIGSSSIIGYLTDYDVAAGIWNSTGTGCQTFTAHTVRLVPDTVSLPVCSEGGCEPPTPGPTSTAGPTETAAAPTVTPVPTTPVPTMTSAPATTTVTPVPPTGTTVPPTVTPAPPTNTKVPATNTTVPATATTAPYCRQTGNKCHEGDPPGCVCRP